MSEGIHAVEISKRPPKSWAKLLHGILSFIVFNFVLSSLMLLSSSSYHPFALHNLGVRFSKGAGSTYCS
jgi:hypothetical protein